MEATISRLKDSFSAITTTTETKEGGYLYLNSSSYRKWNEPTSSQVHSSFEKSLNWILKSKVLPVSYSESARLIPILWDLINHSTEESQASKLKKLLIHHIHRILPPEGLFSLNPVEVTPDLIVVLPILCKLNVINEGPVSLFVIQCLEEIHGLLKQYSSEDPNSSCGSNENLEDLNSGLVVVDAVKCATILSAIYSLNLYHQHSAQCKELEDYVLGCLEAELVEESEVSLSMLVGMVEAAEGSGIELNEFVGQVRGILVDKLMERSAKLSDLACSRDLANCGLRILGLSSLKALDDTSFQSVISCRDLRSLIKLQNSDGSWANDGTEFSEVGEFGQVFATAACMAAVSRFC